MHPNHQVCSYVTVFLPNQVYSLTLPARLGSLTTRISIMDLPMNPQLIPLELILHGKYTCYVSLSNKERFKA